MDPNEASEGILIIWDNRVLELMDREVGMHSIPVVLKIERTIGPGLS